MREAEEGNTRGGQKLNILKRDERKQAVQKSQEINIQQAPKGKCEILEYSHLKKTNSLEWESVCNSVTLALPPIMEKG